MLDKEVKELRRRASKCFTNPSDALVAYRELMARKERGESY